MLAPMTSLPAIPTPGALEAEISQGVDEHLLDVESGSDVIDDGRVVHAG